MDIFKIFLLVTVYIISFIQLSYQFLDPFTVTAIGVIYGIYNMLPSDKKEYVQQKTYRALEFACERLGFCEGCEEYWIPGDINGLENDLRNKVFGQEVAVNLTLIAMKRHLYVDQPDRPLVLSFHGPPGVGKNYVIEQILKNMFRKGSDSKYIHFFRSSIDFPSIKDVSTYKNELVKMIKKSAYRCLRSVFIFDEVEKMPNGVLDVLSGFVKSKKEGEHDFRRVIFILLTNIGQQTLTQLSLNNWKLGIKREDLDLKHVSRMLAKESFNVDGGLKSSGIVENYGISHYIPFLPLEKEHVILCLESAVRKMGQIMSKELTEVVLDELNFQPEELQLFAEGGCKGVKEKAYEVINREQRRRKRLSANLL